MTEVRRSFSLRDSISVHPSGKEYTWLCDKPPCVIAFSDLHLPSWLREALAKHSNQNLTDAPSRNGTSVLPADLEKRVLAYLDRCDPAVSGKGGSNTTFRVACALVRGYDLGRDEALQFLRHYNHKCEPLWSEKELEHKIDDALKTPSDKPRGYLLEESSHRAAPLRAPDLSPEPAAQPVKENHVAAAPKEPEHLDEHATEQELASAIRTHLPPLRCVGKDWYTYTGGQWRRGTREIFRPIALGLQHPRGRTDRRASSALSHVEGEAQVDERAFSSFHKFADKGEILINCANGVLRLGAGRFDLLPHSPEYFFTGQVAANYEPAAEAPTFETVLQQALPDPLDLDLFRTFLGYLLYPDCRFEAAMVCYGEAGTGKGTLAEGIMAALGPDLVSSLSLLQICDPKSFHLVNLRNTAVNISAELNALPMVSAENFKLLVSGEQVAADRKHQDSVSLRTSCKFLFLTNYLPQFYHGTDAELRRLRFLRFARKPAKPDPGLKEQVRGERDGILRLILDGLRDLLTKQQIPQGGDESKATRELFKIQNDPAASFVQTRCRLGPTYEIAKSQLYDEYKKFLDVNGLPEPRDSAKFFKELYNRFRVKATRRRDGDKQLQKVDGITLADEPEK
jgi:P4 family phage/plasmid primase-like protien